MGHRNTAFDLLSLVRMPQFWLGSASQKDLKGRKPIFSLKQKERQNEADAESWHMLAEGRLSSQM